jgi:hypothetical protein
LNLPYNYKWSIQFPNKIFFILKSLLLGNTLCDNNNNECKRCKEKMDIYAYHALSCKFKDHNIKRHDKLVDFLFGYVKKIWPDALKEQKYQLNPQPSSSIIYIRLQQRPGDIKILTWAFSSFNTGPIWLDLTVGNNFMKSHMKMAVKGIGAVATGLQERKRNIYKEKDILGLGLEIFGGQSDGLKTILHKIAKGLSDLSSVSQSEWLHRIRAKLVGYLMYENGRMVLASLMNKDDEEYQYYMNYVFDIEED